MDYGAYYNAAANEAHDSFPASQYLQDRLQETRAKNTHARPKRTRQSDFGPRTNAGRDDDIFLAEAEESKRSASRLYDSSPAAPFAAKYGSESSSASGRRRRGTLGAKEMGEQMDRLMKQNFDLKLELDHRRELTAKLQAEIEYMRETVEEAEQLKEEHAELLRINTNVIEELERRDQALQEAVELICSLEERVEDLEERNTQTRPSTANADSGYAGTETHEQVPPSSPPELPTLPRMPNITARRLPAAASAASQSLHNVVDSPSPVKPRREPLFLSQKKPSTNALRSVYLDAGKEIHTVKSFNSILSKRASTIDEDFLDDDDVLNSPRLSNLSESSFPSIYSPKKVSPEKHTWEPTDEEAQEAAQRLEPHLRQDSIRRVSMWMEGGEPDNETPSKSNAISSPLSVVTARAPSLGRRQASSDTEQFQSLDNALSDVTDRPRNTARPPALRRQYLVPQDVAKHNPRTPTNYGPNGFGEQMLPPTPDTVSTRMLRASRSSIVDEKSLLDTTPRQIQGFETLEPGPQTAPRQMRSSVELYNAHQSNLLYRTTGMGNGTSVREESDSEDDYDASSSTVRDFGMDYEGYPDGSSIFNGTPSRLLKQNKPPATDMFFNANDMSPPRQTFRSEMQRRKSSSEVAPGSRKPSLSRAETSPTFFTSLRSMVNSGPKSPTIDSITSPTQSYHSGSSSNHTAINDQDSQKQSLSPEANRSRSITQKQTDTSPGKSRSTISPQPSSSSSHNAPPSLAKRTQKLFRRLSNSRSDRDRELSPPSLPTLTATPSTRRTSKDVRRPSTSHMNEPARQSQPTDLHRGGSSKDVSSSRPSLQSRTRTSPAAVAGSVRTSSAGTTGSTAATDSSKDKEKRGIFRRGGSVRNAGGRNETQAAPATPTMLEAEGRRGSFREAVTKSAGGKRAWR